MLFVNKNENYNKNEIAKDIAIQICAMNPKYISMNDVDNETVNSLHEQFKKNLNDKIKQKPENIIKKILQGQVNKTLSEVVLDEQQYVKDPSKKIKNFLSESSATVKLFLRVSI